MGFFSIKKKSSRSASPAPAPDATRHSSPSSTIPTSPMVFNETVRPTIQLRVAIHSAAVISREETDELFWIEVDPEAEVDAIRRAISVRTGGVPFALFKVNIPSDAFAQAGEYARYYKERVDLINYFPSFSLDDPTQIRPSLGQSGWQAQLPPTLRIKDWWPSSPTSIDTVSIIVRPLESTSTPSSSSRPFTFLAHIAAPGLSSGGPSSPSLHSSSHSRPQRRLPAPVDIFPTSSIAQLKAALLTADNRPVGHLDKIVLWRVEMSSEEMIVIEQRGGLKSGQMPWPYPPTAQVPIPINDDSLPVSHYFPSGQSDTTNVSLSVWIYPSAQQALARITPIEALNAPSFRYPMIFPIPEIRRTSESHSLPALSPALEHPSFDLSTNTLPAAAGKARRARPSTAPATCNSVSPPVFGASGGGRGGLQSVRGRSPLAPAPAHKSSIKGLGIAGSDLPPISIQDPTVDEMGVDLTRLSLKVNVGETRSSHPGQQEIIWQPAEGGLKRSGTGSRGIRSLANNRSLRAYEIC